MVIRRGAPDTTHFLNVDLTVYSRSDLQPLVSAFGKKVLILYAGRANGRYCAHLELSRITKDADSTIRTFCVLIQALKREALTLWEGAYRRDFDIGIQAEAQPFSHAFEIAHPTVEAAAVAGARIVITIYAPEKQIRSSRAKSVQPTKRSRSTAVR